MWLLVSQIQGDDKMRQINTFSIVAKDQKTGEFGIAVQSKFLACASVVSWAKASAGAIATQSFANLDYGELGLKLLEKGYSAQKTLDALLALDSDNNARQVGIVDKNGNAAAFTGKGCNSWAGHIVGESYCCQGNILAGEAVVKNISDSFLKNKDMPLPERLVEALSAGQEAGGDKRGMQAAGLLVVKEGGSYGGYNDRMIDLRVDDDPLPIEKLKDLLYMHRLYFGNTLPKDVKVVDKEIGLRIQTALTKKGFYSGEINGLFDDSTQKAYISYCGHDNFEERLLSDGKIDMAVIDYLEKSIIS
ncbi:MAG: DUF1028 domain-containing protein [Defluviitaleaceae bacterium]|nr:DUF1028 domain-containing protein [Defluviitaleaceae bacterium]